MSHSVTIKSISLAAAERLATTALAHGEKSGWKLAIAITDRQLGLTFSQQINEFFLIDF